VRGESPVDDGWVGEARRHPGLHFFAQLLDGGNATVQALAEEAVESDLGHVQPAAAFGCEMDLELVGEALGFVRRQNLVEIRILVSAQVIHHQPELAKAAGMETPTRQDLAKLDKKRKKKASSDDSQRPHDPDAKVTKM